MGDVLYHPFFLAFYPPNLQPHPSDVVFGDSRIPMPGAQPVQGLILAGVPAVSRSGHIQMAVAMRPRTKTKPTTWTKCLLTL